MNHVQEHIEKVREALNAVATTTGLMRYEATLWLNVNSEGWLGQSLDIIEQQQREIAELRDYKSRYESVIHGLRDRWNDLSYGGKAVDLIRWMESNTPFTLYECMSCYDEGEIAFEDGDDLKGGPCPHCNKEVSHD